MSDSQRSRMQVRDGSTCPGIQHLWKCANREKCTSSSYRAIVIIITLIPNSPSVHLTLSYVYVWCWLISRDDVFPSSSSSSCIETFSCQSFPLHLPTMNPVVVHTSPMMVSAFGLTLVGIIVSTTYVANGESTYSYSLDSSFDVPTLNLMIDFFLFFFPQLSSSSSSSFVCVFVCVFVYFASGPASSPPIHCLHAILSLSLSIQNPAREKP